jgi:hypothetical protein
MEDRKKPLALSILIWHRRVRKTSGVRQTTHLPRSVNPSSIHREMPFVRRPKMPHTVSENKPVERFHKKGTAPIRNSSTQKEPGNANYRVETHYRQSPAGYA